MHRIAHISSPLRGIELEYFPLSALLLRRGRVRVGVFK
jgi:hypothetical protein